MAEVKYQGPLAPNENGRILWPENLAEKILSTPILQGRQNQSRPSLSAPWVALPRPV